MDFNWGAGNSPTTNSQTFNGVYYNSSANNYAPNGSFGNLQLIGTGFTGTNQVDYNFTSNKITCTSTNVQYNINYQYGIRVENVSPDPTYSARWLITRASGLLEEINLHPLQTVSANSIIGFGGTLSEILNIGDTLEAQFFSNTTNAIVQDYDVFGSPPAITSTVVINRSILNVTTEILLESQRGDISQWGFIKSFIKCIS